MTEQGAVRRLGVIGPREIRQLAEVLTDCVEGGASVSFMLPMTRGPRGHHAGCGRHALGGR